ncbi:MAG: hypothetical protein PHW13_05675 [Methylococcales bacterium]|nr:hypothetical protein [Methylococcales bacterium]
MSLILKPYGAAFPGLCLLAAMLTACSSHPKAPPAEEQAQKLQAVMDNGGYTPARTLDFTSVSEVWNHDGAELDVALIAPKQPGKYPLIIYLPSLGEDATAGRLWRETWARAGYAVFSMQPRAIGLALKEIQPDRHGGADDQPDDADEEETSAKDKSGGAGGKPSRSARNSELRFLGHEYFSIDALKNRMEQLYWAYRQLKARVDMGLPLFAEADLSHTVLAGYDLGAQTVTAVLGEDFMTSLPENKDIKPVAAIVLSPSIDLAEGNVRSRFQKLNLPMLVITGSEDNDPYAISSASVRAAVWEFSPPGGKYLLQLSGDVHGLLAGEDMGGRLNARQQKQGEDAGGGWFGGGGSGGGRFSGFGQQYAGNGGGGQGNGISGFGSQYAGNAGNGNSNGNGGFGGGDSGMSQQYGGNGGGHGGGHGGGKGKGDGGQMHQELGYKQVAAVYSASTAFLDKVTKSDEFGQFWIDDKASIWLDRAGVMKIR